MNIRKVVGLFWRALCAMLLSVVSVAPLYGQIDYTVQGVLVDSLSREPIPGVQIEVFRNDTISVAGFTSIYKGVFMNKFHNGNYVMVATFLGYEPLKARFVVDGENLDLGELAMHETNVAIEAVTVTGDLIRTSMDGDTLVYNAKAYKVAADAEVDKMLSKMPGVVVSDDAIEVQGRNVQKVLVDGREFYGSDPMAAIKNLPADMIESIEVYNKLSDQAEMTGVDDGEGYTAINIITLEDKRNGQFGKFYGAYGYKDKYLLGGSINMMKENRYLSLVGLVNNVNQYNFAMEDILGVTEVSGNGGGSSAARPMDGISQLGAFGLNYNNRWGKKASVSFSYFFNKVDNYNLRTTDRQTFTSTDKIVLYDADAATEALNYNHRFNGRFDWKPTSKQSLLFRPSISIQDYANQSSTISHTNNLLASDTTFVYNRSNFSNTTQFGINASGSLTYRLQLRQPRESLVATVSGRYSSNDRLYLPEQYTFRDADDTEMNIENATAALLQKQIRNQPAYNWRGTLAYTLPLSKSSVLSAEYRINNNRSSTDRRTYIKNTIEGDFPADYNPRQTTIFSSSFLTNTVGMSYRYNRKRNNVSAGVFYQKLDYDGDYKAPNEYKVNTSFDNLIYNVVANVYINRQNRIRIDANSGINTPSATQLQNVPNMTNTQYVTSGNPDLRQSYTHSIRANYTRTVTSAGRTFTVGVIYRMSDSYIGDSIVLDNPQYILPNNNRLGAGNQYTKPVNLEGYNNLRITSSYGLPLRFIGSNLNINAGATFGHVPAIINGDLSILNSRAANLGATLSSNVSENLDFSISYTGRYNLNRNYQRGKLRENSFVTQYVKGNIKWVTPHKFTFVSTVSWSDYTGITDVFNKNYLLCNIYIGHKVLPRGLGELSIGVNDLFDQNGDVFRRTVTNTAVTNTTNLSIGRYVAVQFIYNLRLYKKKFNVDRLGDTNNFRSRTNANRSNATGPYRNNSSRSNASDQRRGGLGDGFNQNIED